MDLLQLRRSVSVLLMEHSDAEHSRRPVQPPGYSKTCSDHIKFKKNTIQKLSARVQAIVGCDGLAVLVPLGVLVALDA